VLPWRASSARVERWVRLVDVEGSSGPRNELSR
jgi:hypothetical protein